MSHGDLTQPTDFFDQCLRQLEPCTNKRCEGKAPLGGQVSHHLDQIGLHLGLPNVWLTHLHVQPTDKVLLADVGYGFIQ